MSSHSSLNRAQEHLRDVLEVMGSIAVRDSDFFFVPHSFHVDQFTFHFCLMCFNYVSRLVFGWLMRLTP